MKISVSLLAEDVEVLDEYVRDRGLASRSAAVQYAIRALRHPDLENDYAAAWRDWADSGDEAAWEATAGDGAMDAPR